MHIVLGLAALVLPQSAFASDCTDAYDPSSPTPRIDYYRCLDAAVSAQNDAIATNSLGILVNSGRAFDNTEAIDANAVLIGDNALAIIGNADGITTNADGIAANARDIATNVGLIGDNAAALAGTATDLDSLTADVGDVLLAVDDNAVLIGDNAALIAGNTAAVELANEWENVRMLLPKSSANAQCPAGTAIHVPRGWAGRTGDEICAGDGRGLTTCQAVEFVYITNGNGTGSYDPANLDCSNPVDWPWPWGVSYGSPNTLDAEWGHGNTWVVCCS